MSVALVGVRTHTAPSKRSGAAPRSPICSEPAIGCPPMKRGWSAASTMAVLTPLTSVTTASCRRLRRGEDPADLLGHRRGRGGDEDDFGLEVVAGLIDHARARAPRRCVLVGIEAADVPAALTKGESYRSTDEAGPHDERPRARPAVRPGGHRGALGHRGDRRGGFRPWSWWCARGAGHGCTAAWPRARRSRPRTASGTAPKPISLMAVAGKMLVTSAVAVKRTLTMSSSVRSLRSISRRISSCERCVTCSTVSASTVVAPRRPRTMRGAAMGAHSTAGGQGAERARANGGGLRQVRGAAGVRGWSGGVPGWVPGHGGKIVDKGDGLSHI